MTEFIILENLVYAKLTPLGRLPNTFAINVGSAYTRIKMRHSTPTEPNNAAAESLGDTHASERHQHNAFKAGKKS